MRSAPSAGPPHAFSRPRCDGLSRECRWVAVSLLAFVLFGPGCAREPVARVVSAEFLDDETPDGKAVQNETIRLRLDRDLPAGFSTKQVTVGTRPSTGPWSSEVSVSALRDVLLVRIVAGTPSFQPAGVYRPDGSATGLVVDLGDGVEQVVDLQLSRIVPRLERVYWEDASPGGGNGVVDGGDILRLVFDQPVRLTSGSDTERVQVPRDILLARDGVDRLDNGVEPSLFRPGSAPEEIELVLGADPVLRVAGPAQLSASGAVVAGSERYSALAVNGTDIYPMPRISALAGGPGCASLREVPVELPEGYPGPSISVTRRDVFPEPGPRMFHTLTPVALFHAIVAGGVTVEGGEVLNQVLLYNPFSAAVNRQPFTVLESSLPDASYHHTATLLTGADGTPGTLDDLVVIAGGEDGTRTLAHLAVVRVKEGRFSVQHIDAALEISRAEHQAVAIGPGEILIDGGRHREPDGDDMIVGCAEILSFSLPAPDSAENVTVTAHRLFRSLPRMEHSLSFLGREPDGTRWVLAYGGYGQNRRVIERSSGTTAVTRPFGAPVEVPLDDHGGFLFPPSSGSVLVSPVIIDVSTPERSVTDMPYDFSFSLLRRGHRAVGIDPRGSPSGRVIILGGTLRHPIHGFDGDPRLLWDVTLEDILRLRAPIESQYALNAVEFSLDPLDPSASRLTVAPHPYPLPAQLPTRVRSSATYVPGLGALIAGGERPEDAFPLESLEVYLSEEARLMPFAVSLPAARSRHEAYLVTDDDTGRRSLLLIGGSGPPDAPGGLTDVEEIPLPGQAP